MLNHSTDQTQKSEPICHQCYCLRADCHVCQEAHMPGARADSSGRCETCHVSRVLCRCDVHPDLPYIPNSEALKPFLKSSNNGSKRKRESGPCSNSANDFWASEDLQTCRRLFQQWQRSKNPVAEGQLNADYIGTCRLYPTRLTTTDIFLVDVCETSCPSEQATFRNEAHCKNPSSPVVNVLGVCLDGGSSISMRVWGVHPYVVIECPQALESTPSVQLCAALTQYLESNLPASKDVVDKVIGIRMISGESLMEYKPSRSKTFFKVYLANTRLVGNCKSAIENGIPLLGHQIDPIPFEACVPYNLRWMIDKEIVGCGYIRVKRADLIDVSSNNRSTRCTREVDILNCNIESLSNSADHLSIPDTLRILALDIECVTVASHGFPKPELDPIIQISSIITSPGRSTPLVKMIFTLDVCAPVAGSVVLSFDDERAMLSTWREMVVYTDPDILTGYNFINFDLNYLILRSIKLDIPNFRNLGRVIDVETKIRDSILSTKALGTHENKDINIEGRIQFDALDCIRREYKLKSYTLNGVSAHFLKEQKEDVHYSEIGNLQRGNPETRKRIAVYCIKDSWLVLRLVEALSLLVNYIEMARVTGVPINMLLSRGQQIKVTSQLLRKCREMKVYMPSLRITGGTGEVAYEGATVLDPMKDFYDLPIATLDFASLYPSIMIAHNLCYSTLVPPDRVKDLRSDEYFRTPADKVFVKPSVKRGILPSIVSDLMSARKRAKNELKQATDSLTKIVLEARQLALKISANSVYGYTGASSNGQLPCLPISESITAYGRQMIDVSKEVERKFRKENGYEFDATVVYGDTDSIMVKFGTNEVKRAMELGREAAGFVSSKFLTPISLEFEKVFFPFLLMNKKRYAGLMWTSPDKYNRVDCKGIETVRRDFCLLVQKMVDDALKALLIDRDVNAAREMTKQRIQDLLLNKIDMSYLVLSKSLGKEEYSAKLAHVELAKKLRKRDPATAPQIGDRVYYVIIAGAKGQPQFERAEDPLYALENNIPIDVDFYLDSIKNPITRIFEPIEKGKVSNLFSGEHTRQRKMVTSTTGALSGFVKTGIRCLGCRGVLKEGAFCKHCREKENKEQEVVLDKLVEFSEKEQEFSRLWVECQRCQESLHQDVICTSRDCPIFYKRMKVKKELIEMKNGTMARLSLEDW